MVIGKNAAKQDGMCVMCHFMITTGNRCILKEILKVHLMALLIHRL